MNALQRRGRAAAVVGGLVAAGATTVLVLVGTASAAEQGHCSDNVNVRSQPAATASVVTVCKRGTAVTLGEHKNGYVQLTNLNGWASEQYITSGSAGSTKTTTHASGTTAPTTSGTARGEQVRPTTSAPATTKSAPATTKSAERPTTAPATTTSGHPATTATHEAPATSSTSAPAAAQGGQAGGDGSSSDGTPARAPGLLGR